MQLVKFCNTLPDKFIFSTYLKFSLPSIRKWKFTDKLLKNASLPVVGRRTSSERGPQIPASEWRAPRGNQCFRNASGSSCKDCLRPRGSSAVSRSGKYHVHVHVSYSSSLIDIRIKQQNLDWINREILIFGCALIHLNLAFGLWRNFI